MSQAPKAFEEITWADITKLMYSVDKSLLDRVAYCIQCAHWKGYRKHEVNGAACFAHGELFCHETLRTHTITISGGVKYCGDCGRRPCKLTIHAGEYEKNGPEWLWLDSHRLLDKRKRPLRSTSRRARHST